MITLIGEDGEAAGRSGLDDEASLAIRRTDCVRSGAFRGDEVASPLEAGFWRDFEGDNTSASGGMRTDKTRFGVEFCFIGEAVTEGVASTVALPFLFDLRHRMVHHDILPDPS